MNDDYQPTTDPFETALPRSGRVASKVNGRRIGRPRIFDSPEAFEKAANAYFEECNFTGEPYLITGLALYMGLGSRQSLAEYENRPEFKKVVTAARSRVEMSYEHRLQEAKPTGAIFALKNMGWRDEKHVDLTNSDGSLTGSLNVTVTIDTAKLTTEQLAALWGAMTVIENVPNGQDIPPATNQVIAIT